MTLGKPCKCDATCLVVSSFVYHFDHIDRSSTAFRSCFSGFEIDEDLRAYPPGNVMTFLALVLL